MSLDILYAGEVLDDLQAQDRYMELRNMLRDHNCEVTFTKVDGTIRTMPCTLRPEVIPARDASKVTEAKEPTYKNISVWCLDKNEWRSFRVANVKEVKVLHD